MTIPDVLQQYETRLSQARAAMSEAQLHYAGAVGLLALAAIVFVMTGVAAIRKQAPVWWPSLPVPVAALGAQRFLRSRQTSSRMWRLTRFYDRAVQRVKGEWPGHGLSGQAFSDSAHPYSNDLNLFGEGSLFELLCIGRSGVGQRGLARYLLDAPSLEESLARQQAVRELQSGAGLREQAALLGPFEFSESKWETFTDWLDSPAVPFPPSLSRILLGTSAALAVILAAGLIAGGTLAPWALIATWMAPFLLFHGAIGLLLRERVNRMVDSLGALSSETRVIREGLHLLETQQFESPKLRQLAASVQHGSAALRRLERWLSPLNERNKEWFYLLSRALMAGSQMCMAIEAWRAQHGASLRVWLDAWAEFEALNALACYAYENPGDAFPELAAGGACFEARALGHPLLDRETCVLNDIELNAGRRFYIVSGSNMSGKSTLLRSIGLNAVLAMAGGPVRAQSLRLSQLSVCASLSVVDSLLQGKSKFMAEVDRLRQAIELSAGGRPVLFLIDEIFSGTNSHDRRAAAEAVVRTLIGRGAIGALSTHDLALSEIADEPALGGGNAHMGSRGMGDPMDFDYLLKPGVTREANALAIARMAGVPV